MAHVELRLIKDFDAELQRIILYWVDETSAKVSPEFFSVSNAHIWWIEFQSAQYDGVERRMSGLDRRWLLTQRVQQTNGIIRHSDAPDGRRYTDQNISVTRDVSRVRLLQYYASNPELHEKEESPADPIQEALNRWGVRKSEG